MITKCIEIRDRATCIPALAMLMTWNGKAQLHFFRRCGYPLWNDGTGLETTNPSIILMRLSDQRAHSDPYDWKDRTHQIAHLWLLDNWERVGDGDVVDVEFILDETDSPKTPEIMGE
jgi:hypothetical protein